jgi:F-type H+-transporting ATPase subunit c
MVRKFGVIVSAVTAIVLVSPLFAMAQEAAGAAAAGNPLRAGLIAIAANIGIGIAAFGSAIGQGRMAASAMESIGRNPNSAGQIFTPMIIGLAFIEALTLYALVIAFFLQAKI